MAVTFSWSFPNRSMLYQLQADGVTKLVKTVAATLSATDGTNTEVLNLSLDLKTPPATAKLIAFEDVTLMIASKWVESVIGASALAAMKVNMEAKLAARSNPIVAVAAPWTVTPAAPTSAAPAATTPTTTSVS